MGTKAPKGCDQRIAATSVRPAVCLEPLIEKREIAKYAISLCVLEPMNGVEPLTC